MNEISVLVELTHEDDLYMFISPEEAALDTARRQHHGELDDGVIARFFNESAEELFFDFEQDTFTTTQPETPKCELS